MFDRWIISKECVDLFAWSSVRWLASGLGSLGECCNPRCNPNNPASWRDIIWTKIVQWTGIPLKVIRLSISLWSGWQSECLRSGWGYLIGPSMPKTRQLFFTELVTLNQFFPHFDIGRQWEIKKNTPGSTQDRPDSDINHMPPPIAVGGSNVGVKTRKVHS